jgi:hypothetical protein
MDGDLLRMDSEQRRARHHRVGAASVDLKKLLFTSRVKKSYAKL